MEETAFLALLNDIRSKKARRRQSDATGSRQVCKSVRGNNRFLRRNGYRGNSRHESGYNRNSDHL